MLQFHQRLKPFKAISFDLDDTLYDNRPVMRKAEQHLVDYLKQIWPQTSHMGVIEWRALRDEVAATDSLLAGNMTALRLVTLRKGLMKTGVDEHTATVAADDAMNVFLQARNDVSVPQATHRLLARLSQRWPLVALSNGNVDINRIGLGQYFVGCWQPTDELRGKPAPDMFEAASRHLELSHQDQLLHIGDHPEYDVAGALRYGAQAIWFAHEASEQILWLPTATATSIEALEHLLLD